MASVRKRNKKKRSVGKPTLYRPEHCVSLIDHMAKGLSFETFGVVITPRVHRSTLYDWEKAHPEFAEAHKIGVDAARLFWEQKGIDNLELGENQKFSNAVWIFTMKARFGMKEPQTPNILNVQTFQGNNVQAELKSIDTDTLKRLYAEKRKELGHAIQIEGSTRVPVREQAAGGKTIFDGDPERGLPDFAGTQG